MRKVFYVKKDPTMPESNDSWIEMNSFEFEQFIHTPEGHERRYNFGRLDACSEDDAIIYIECGAETAKKWKTESNRREYVQNLRKSCGVTICSYSSMASEDSPFETYSGEQYLEDTNYNLEEIVMRNLDIERMHLALSQLADEERKLIESLFLSDNTLTVEQYAANVGRDKSVISRKKDRILRKLKKIMDN